MNFKKLVSKYLPAVPVALVLGQMFFSPSCANTTQAPTGGKKDTIPPVIVGLSPLPGAVNVPTHKAQIRITFDEYVQVKDAKSIYLSPPQEKTPKYKMSGKTLIVYFEEDLDPDKTYTLDLTNAIADNNEGNMYPGYTLTFSTGENIDSMVVTGTVRDCNTLQPIKGATVMLYKDLADSAVFLHRPDAAVKTDEWGFFSLRNVADTLYRLYAVMDEGSNNIYDPDNDKVAFIDTVFRPTMVVSDTLPELLKYDMKDTANCMARRSEHELYMFREKPSKQLIVNKERVGIRTAYITFMAPNAQIDSIWVRNVPSNKLILQFNPQRDSLEIWINDRARRQPDTLHAFVDYLKTDTLGKLVPFTEHVRLANGEVISQMRNMRRNVKHEDTTCVVKITAESERVEQYGFEFEFKYPLIYESFDSLSLISINPRQQEEAMKFKVTRDSTNLRKYTLMPEDKLMTGYEYKLKVPWRKFRDVNGFYNDSSEVKVSLPKDDKLSLLTVPLTGVHHTYIVDLLNEKRDRVLRSYNINSDCTLNFPYLKAGKYSIRITEDKNGNGLVETGSLLEHRQPEKVKFYTLRDGSYVLEVLEATELEQNIDIAKLFED
ncbi:MAG: Ig-like domain-containing protein [Bacteroidales bacterium]|nr:Ig-like domain-containing protein [Bacteroidales bacterium]